MPSMDHGEGFTLRAATDADVPAITALLKAAFAEQATLLPPSGALSETDEKVREVMRVADVLLAVSDGTIVGCVFHETEGDWIRTHCTSFASPCCPHTVAGASPDALLRTCERLPYRTVSFVRG